MKPAAPRPIPLWLKIVCTGFVAVHVPVYWYHLIAWMAALAAVWVPTHLLVRRFLPPARACAGKESPIAAHY